MKKSFRKHQYKMFAYCMKERHPALFVEMRLGKCLVTIRRCMLYKPIDPVRGLKILVIAPSSAIGSWCDELTAEGHAYTLLLGPREKRIENLTMTGTETNWYIINKEIAPSINKETGKRRCVIGSYIADQDWDAVIADESPFMKNPKSNISKYMKKHFRDVPHRWALTGTPAPENILEYFPQFQFLDGRAFGYKDFWHFRAKECRVTWGGHTWEPLPEMRDYMQEYVGKRAFIMSREDAGIQISKEQLVRKLTMPPEIRKLYDEAESDFALGGQETIWATTRYHWLRQLCGGIDATTKQVLWDGKMQELLYLLQTELKGAKVCVWFHYNTELHAVEKFMELAGIPRYRIYGDMTLQQRRHEIRLWSMDKKPAPLLVQQAVAQMGMDLSASDTIVYYSQSPSILATSQGQDRILSLSKNTTLLYLYLLVENSVDTDLNVLLKTKKWKSDLDLRKAAMLAAANRHHNLRTLKGTLAVH